MRQRESSWKIRYFGSVFENQKYFLDLSPKNYRDTQSAACFLPKMDGMESAAYSIIQIIFDPGGFYQ
jgi:hypothetical protein